MHETTTFLLVALSTIHLLLHFSLTDTCQHHTLNGAFSVSSSRAVGRYEDYSATLLRLKVSRCDQGGYASHTEWPTITRAAELRTVARGVQHLGPSPSTCTLHGLAGVPDSETTETQSTQHFLKPIQHL